MWLERWHGRSPRALPSAEELPTLAAIVDRWRGIEHRLCEYVAGLKEEALARPLTYTNLTGETWTYPLWRTLLHLLNHQTYHRGQVATLLRQLGVQPTAVDLLVADDSGLFDIAMHG